MVKRYLSAPPRRRAFKKRRYARRPLRARASQGELKFFDTHRGNVAADTAGAILQTSLCLIPQGVTESNRVGRKCTIKAIQIKGNIQLNNFSDVTAGGQRLRIMVYLDKQCNGATALVDDILEDVATSGLDSFRNLSNVGRFDILYDKTIVVKPAAGMGNGTANDTVETFYQWNLYKKCSIPIEFSSTTGALTELRSNNIGVLTVVEAAAPAVGVGFNCRLRFGDH